MHVVFTVVLVACLMRSVAGSAQDFIEDMLSPDRNGLFYGSKIIDDRAPKEVRAHTRLDRYDNLLNECLKGALVKERNPVTQIYWINRIRPEYRISRILPDTEAGNLLRLGKNDIGFAFWRVEGWQLWDLRTFAKLTGANTKLTQVYPQMSSSARDFVV
ncbi:hypothetical protein BCV70DRAFT_217838 [Testicularia cyperi]|uniref:Uncharacterized protein n=1 Tax=Testicularia cyperi TaxID=1882483 RepID=A0A317XME7_9BASI|nr:hypothetical protein BCV70DRAFT_217838 [Testicularia cyperi]